MGAQASTSFCTCRVTYLRLSGKRSDTTSTTSGDEGAIAEVTVEIQFVCLNALESSKFQLSSQLNWARSTREVSIFRELALALAAAAELQHHLTH